MDVARVFVDHRLELSSAAKLLDEIEQLPPPSADRIPKQFLDPFMKDTASNLRLQRIRLAVAQDDFAAASKLLADYVPEKNHTNGAAIARARVLHHEGRFGDALALLIPVADQREAKRALASVWADLNGTQDSLNVLLAKGSSAKKEDAERWSKIGKALPKLSLTDTSGRKWANKDLAGKRVFINVWASWCGPCKEELPHVVRLAALAKDKNLIVLTANVDEDPAAAEAYLALHPLNVPVLMGMRKIIGELTSVSSIPRSWLVDQKGVLTHEVIGFERVDDWAEKMLAQIETLAR